jgi:hypothetical protein
VLASDDSGVCCWKFSEPVHIPEFDQPGLCFVSKRAFTAIGLKIDISVPQMA